MSLPDALDLLVVEADPLESELILRALGESSDAGRIGLARDGEEALEWLLGRGAYRHRLGGALPQVVLMGLRLPRLDAVEVLRTLRANPRTTTVPVVVLTSSAEARELAQCYQAGANSCIRKPVDFGAFAETLRLVRRYWLTLNRTASQPAALA